MYSSSVRQIVITPGFFPDISRFDVLIFYSDGSIHRHQMRYLPKTVRYLVRDFKPEKRTVGKKTIYNFC